MLIVVPRILVPVALLLTLLFASGIGLPADAQSPPPGDRATRTYVGSAPVVFAPGELVPLNGIVVMNTLDVVFDPVGGLFCQPLPGDTTDCTFAHPTAVSFCHGVTLRDGENWDSTVETWVYVGYPYDRMAPGNDCSRPAPATAGVISWWPNPESL